MVGHFAVWIAKMDPIGIERGAQRAAGVARGRRDKEALETRLSQDSCVGHTVQRHTATETQIGQTGFLMERTSHLHECVLEDPLHAGGAVGETLALGSLEIDRLMRVPRRPE